MSGRTRRTIGGRHKDLWISILTVLLLVFFTCPLPAMAQEAKTAASDTAKDEEDVSEFVMPVPAPWKGDFDGMKTRRHIRMLVPYSRTFFFLDGADMRGTAHDIGKAFEEWLNKKHKTKALRILVTFIPTSRDRLLPGLREGLGDIAAGNLTVTPERLKTVDFSDPFLKDVKEVVVTGPSTPSVNSIEDLGGKEIHVRKSSSYYEHILELNKKLPKKIRIKAADEDLEDEDLLEMVNAGLIPMVVVDDHKAKLWAQVFDKIKVREDLVVNEGGGIAWAVRKQSPLLVAEINGFLHGYAKKTGFSKEIYRRYFGSAKYVKNSTSRKEMEKFSKLVSLFKQYGEKYDFDHLMLMAQGYQESQLDQSARSPRGAVGVMQLLPSTAEGDPIGIKGVDADAEKNIQAGAKYLRHLVDTTLDDPAIDGKNRTLMAFAAYNAGPGNLRKFRRIAEKSGLNPNIWFHNVEIAAARVVGRETVQYVSNIYKYYTAYRLLEERKKLRKGG